MKKGIETRFRFPLFCVVVSLILMNWVVAVSLAEGLYPMTTSANPASGGTVVANPTSVAEGGSVIFTANANNGYYIERVILDGETVFTQSLPLSYTIPTNYPRTQVTATFSGVSESHHMSVDFRRYYELFSTAVTTGGTISPDGLIPVPEGSSKSYTITPFEGFHTVNVTVNGASQGPVPTVSLTNIMSDYEIFASFERDTPPTHTVTPIAGEGGSISPSEPTEVPHGGSLTLMFTPDDCYKVSNVIINGQSLGPAPGVILDPIEQDITVQVVFELVDPYTITVITNGNGTVSPMQNGGVFGPGSGQFQVRVPCGGGWIFTITPDGCCRIGNVRVDGVSRVVQEELQFSNVQRNHTVEITFEPIYLTIAPGVEGDGTINPRVPVTVPIGSSLACTMTPGPCQWPSDLLVDGASVMNSDTLISLLSTGGSMQRLSQMASGNSKPGMLANGDSIVYPLPGKDTLTFDPVNGVLIYTFNDIESDHSITPIFAEMVFTIYTTADAPANVVPLGETDMLCSETQPLQLELDGHPIARGYITIDNTLSCSVLLKASDLKITAKDGLDDEFIVDITIDPVNDAPEPIAQEIAIEPDIDWTLDRVTIDDRTFAGFTYFNPTTGLFTLDDLVISEKIELTFVPIFHTVTSWVTRGYDIDTASIPYSIAPTQEQVNDGGSVSLRIEEDLAEADCYDFELRITPEGGQTMVVSKADLLLGNQADMMNQVNVYTYMISDIRTNYTVELIYRRTKITMTITTNDGGMVGPTQDGGTIGPEADEFQLDLPCNDPPQPVEIAPFGDNVIGDVKFNGDSLLDLILELFPDAANGVDESDEPLLIFPLTDPGDMDFRIYIQSMPRIVDIPDLFPDAPVPYTDERLPGEEFTRSSVPNDQPFKFTIDWKIDLTAEGDPPYEFRPITLEPEFLETHPIAVKAGPGGSVDIVRDREAKIYVLHGQDRTLTLKPDPGHHIETVKIDGAAVQLTDNKSFTHTFPRVVSDEHSIEATFALDMYTITPSVEGNGTIDPPEAVQVAHGEFVDFTIRPADRHKIKDILIDGESIMPNGMPDPVPLDPDLSISIVQIFTEFGTFELHGGMLGKFSFNLVDSDHSIKVIFERVCTISVSTNDIGSVKIVEDGFSTALPSGSLESVVPCGESRTMEATPGDCYLIDDVQVTQDGGDPVSIMGNVSIDESGKGTFVIPNIQGDVSVSVTFKKIGPFTVTTSLRREDGEPVPVGNHPYLISPAGETQVECGGSFILTITEPRIPCHDFKLIITAEGGESVGMEKVIDKADLLRTGLLDPEYQYGLSDIRTNYTIEVVYSVREVRLATRVLPGDDGVEHGSISPGYSGEMVRCGEAMEFAITPDPCFWLDKMVLSIDGGDPIQVTEYVVIDPATGVGVYTIPITGNTTIAVTFERLGPYTVTTSVKPGADGLPHGTASPDGETKVDCGSDLEITMEPDDCYVLGDIIVTREGGAPESVMEDVVEAVYPDGSIHSYFYILRDIMSDCSVEITFKKLGPFYINASAGPGGRIEPGGAEIQVECGEDKIFTITPDQGYRLDTLLVDGKEESPLSAWSSGPSFDYVFPNVRDNHTIHVTFRKYQYLIEATAEEGGGTIDPSGDVKVSEGSSQKFTVKGDPGYAIDVLSVDGKPIDVGNLPSEYVYTFEDVKEDHRITAYFIKYHTIKASASDGGTIEGSGDVRVRDGGSAIFLMEADEKHCVHKVLVNGEVVYGTDLDALQAQPSDYSHIFENVKEDQTIHVSFSKCCEVKATAEKGGAISPEGIVRILPGGTLTFKITADRYYHIEEVLVDGVPYLERIKRVSDGEVDYYYDDGPRERRVTMSCEGEEPQDHTIHVTFGGGPPPIYTVKSSRSGSGSISPEGDTQVTEGEDATYIIDADDGNYIKEILVDNEPVAMSGTMGYRVYTFTKVAADHTIEVTFARAYTIKASHGTETTDFAGGTTDPEFQALVPPNGDQDCRISADSGYSIEKLLVDGEPVQLPLPPVGETLTEYTYTFRDVTADHTISVIFAKGFPRGDVNRDGITNSKDALLVLKIEVGMIEATEEQKRDADVNGDGFVDANDAIAILNGSVGSKAPTVNTEKELRRSIAISLTNTHGTAGEKMTASVSVENADLLAGGDILIAYDNSVLRAISLASENKVLMATDFTKPGEIRIAFAGQIGAISGILTSIEFDILSDDLSPLEFKHARLYGFSAQLLTSICIDGEFRSWAMPADHAALLQNYPNPFNPETWIPYQLTEDSDVTVRIYSTTGQLVRTMNLGYRESGSYVTRDRAIHWDGNNEAGESVASGIYFYNIQAGDYIATRKMTVTR
ncbi:FlgD immunoglobulin-like domain containing protein [Candidatus Poribacteria bacterium]